MDDASERLIREFMLVANGMMNRIPRPVPEGPEGGPWPSVLQELEEWDGEVLDVRALHRAYNRLPANLQEIVAGGYGRCLEVLAHQHRTAMGALSARFQVFADVMDGTGLTPEQLVPDLYPEVHPEVYPEVYGDGDMEPEPDDADASEGRAPGVTPRGAEDTRARPPLRLVPPTAPTAPISPIVDDDMDGAVFGHGARRWMRRAVHASAAAGVLMAAFGLGSLAWQGSNTAPSTGHARSSDTLMPATSRDREPVVPRVQRAEREATRSAREPATGAPVIRMRSRRDRERAVDRELHDSFSDQSAW